jgi:hypothetical protein
MLVCWIVDQIFIEESDVPVTAAAGRAVGGAA